MSRQLRAQRRRAERESRKALESLTFTVAIPIPAEIQPWERELLLPFVQDLLEGMVKEALSDDEGEED